MTRDPRVDPRPGDVVSKRKKRQRIKLPDDPTEAFAYLVSRCASGLYRELAELGKSDIQARNTVIHHFLAMAAGEACRIARSEGRVPDVRKWRKATRAAFDRAVERTATIIQRGRDD